MAESYGEALSFLQKTATETGGTVYDQVVDVLSKVCSKAREGIERIRRLVSFFTPNTKTNN